MKIKSKNEIKSPKDFSEDYFQNLVKKKINGFSIKFNKDFKIHTLPLNFVKEECERIKHELNNLFESRQDLTTSYFEIQNLKEKNKNLTFAKAIKNYSKGSKEKQKVFFEFVAKVVGFQEILMFLNNKNLPTIQDKNSGLKSDPPKTNQSKIINQTNENRISEFTTARKVLLLSYLMEKSLDDNLKPDKTIIAKFIQSLINDKPVSGNIINSNTYKKVKGLFFDTDKANVKDLLFVKKEFDNLRISEIVQIIDLQLKKKKQKK